MSATVVESATLSTSHPKYPDEIHTFETPLEYAEFFDNTRMEAPASWTPEMKKVWQETLASNYQYRSARDKFNSVPTVEQALELLKYGWKEGRERMLEWQGAVQSALSRRVDVPHFRLGEDGSDVDMGRFMSGEPEHMVGYGTVDTAKMSPIILVENNIACNACQSKACDFRPADPDWAMMRGAVLFLLVKFMRSSGMFPEVWIGQSAFYDNHTHSIKGAVSGFQHKNAGFTVDGGGRNDYANGVKLEKPIKAKKRSLLVRAVAPDSYLDPSQLAFMLAHDGMARRLGFRFEELMNYREAGVFPSFIIGVEGGRGVKLGGKTPLDVGALPGGGQRGYTIYRPAWASLVKPYEQRATILLPSYTSLADAHDTGNEDAGKAIGAFGGPEQAAEYLLNTLEKAGVRLS